MSESSPRPIHASRSTTIRIFVAIFLVTFCVSIVAARNLSDVKIALAFAVVLSARRSWSEISVAIAGIVAGHLVLGSTVGVGQWSIIAWVVVAGVAAVETAALARFFGRSIAVADSTNPIRRFTELLASLLLVSAAGGALESWLLSLTDADVSASTLDIMFGTAVGASLAAIVLTRRGSDWLTSTRTPGAELLAPLVVVFVTLAALQVTRQVWEQRDDDRLDVLARSVHATLSIQWDRETEVLRSTAQSFAPALAFDSSIFAELVGPYVRDNSIAIAAALEERAANRPPTIIEHIDDGSLPATLGDDLWIGRDEVVSRPDDDTFPVIVRTVDLTTLPGGGQLALSVAFSLPELVTSATNDIGGRYDDVVVVLSTGEGTREVELFRSEDIDSRSEQVEGGSILFGDNEIHAGIVPKPDFGASGLGIALAIELALGSLLCAVLLLAANAEFKLGQERRRRENLLEAALDATPGMSVVFDRDLRILAANRPVRLQHPSEIPGLEVVLLFGLDGDGGRRRLVEDLLREALSGKPGHIEIAEDPRSEDEGSMSSTSRMRIIELSAYPVVSPGGEPIGFLHSVDTTERRSLAMRSAQSERMESLGALAGGLAHDFNNLLFVTLGNLQLMAMNDAVVRDEKLSKFVSRSMSAVERGAEITKSLLAVARSQPLEESAVSLADLVKGILPLVRQALGSGRRVEVDIPDPNLQLMVDSGRLSSCILNLAFNARDAMGPNGVLRISGRLDDSGDMIELSVADDGAGMPEDVVARAFEPFFTTKSPGSGTGLGLATVYAFAKQSGGTAFLESHTGVGTTVTLVLPRFTGEVVSAAVERTRRSGRRVVVADDEQALAEMVAAWLIDMGIDARFATSPKAALELIEDFEPDVLVSDANFGEELDGIELARLGTAILPDMAVVFMTGYSTAMRELQELGERTLAKPFSREDLYGALSPLIAEDPRMSTRSEADPGSARRRKRQS